MPPQNLRKRGALRGLTAGCGGDIKARSEIDAGSRAGAEAMPRRYCLRCYASKDAGV